MLKKNKTQTQNIKIKNGSPNFELSLKDCISKQNNYNQSFICKPNKIKNETLKEDNSNLLKVKTNTIKYYNLV